MTARRVTAGRLVWSILALLPIAILIAVNNHEVLLWLQTGHCPGGPMDRPAGPCGPIDFILIVLLGGWVAFLMIPVLIGWWICLLVASGLVRHLANRKVPE